MSAWRYATAAVLAVLVTAPGAIAQDSGVVVDPDSPSGKEYALPLDSARRQAAPQDAPAASGNDSESPIFGAGVQPPKDSSGGSSKGSSPRSAGGQAEPVTPGPSGDSAAGEALRAAATQPGAPDGGIGTLLAIAGVAAAVLAVGGAAGLALRRRGDAGAANPS